MTKVNKRLIILNIITCVIGLLLIQHIVAKENQYRESVYKLRSDIREREFELEMATMHIEWMNKEDIKNEN